MAVLIDTAQKLLDVTVVAFQRNVRLDRRSAADNALCIIFHVFVRKLPVGTGPGAGLSKLTQILRVKSEIQLDILERNI